ncbi:hypothetical protein ROSINTL182_07413 [Roseburia intestinalis L1-82]|uniref:Uncharacterized protein n=2 Tax=Roseburia intestinalis L1-82 TaxID=536231 RepID=C7GBX8_9FIRM|nr:hypothetical protein ROSINTL182_07413 [Roseburia intestinalis L1-82]
MFNHIRLCYDVIVFIRTTIKKRGIGMSDFNQNNDDEDIVVTLDLDDGSQVECEILTIFTIGERDYIALLPLDENGEENEAGEVFIYRYSEDSEGNPSLDNIEDDEEYEAVSDRFDELLDEAAFEEMDD